ncbi:MAG: helix-turn-helix domain-containing protein [Streptosporangiaceae bacterium]
MTARPAEDAPAHPAYYTVIEAAAYLKVGRRTVYELIASGQLKTIRIGAPGKRGTHRIPGFRMAEYEASLCAEA